MLFKRYRTFLWILRSTNYYCIIIIVYHTSLSYIHWIEHSDWLMRGIYFWIYTNGDIFTFLYRFQNLSPLQELNPGLQIPKPETYSWATRPTIVYFNKKQGLLGNYLATPSKNPFHSKKRSLLLIVDHPQKVKIMIGLK